MTRVVGIMIIKRTTKHYVSNKYEKEHMKATPVVVEDK